MCFLDQGCCLQAVAAVAPILEAIASPEDAQHIAKEFVHRIESEDEMRGKDNEQEEEEGEPLTDKPLKFSLAYGTS